ncbi:Dimer Tnp hAT domain-containing protein [Aphis craccivora]|uniref:Dimer Tnp hAT domain-containing protein n=1 Tax=Aphis craccivora TaxID=307492 RepID=A0A6G0Z600_APHCR|nr:Dimer Tnp hAT domain-containing protein [Aphis craccivora]
MKYAPITSVDVDSLFSMYKNILLENRVSFTTANLGKYMVVNSFFNFFYLFL